MVSRRVVLGEDGFRGTFFFGKGYMKFIIVQVWSGG